MTYALDTCIIICHLNNDEILKRKMEEVIFAGNKFIIPPVVDYEIQRGLLYKSSLKKKNVYNVFRKHYGVGDMNINMWVHAAHIYVNLRQKGFSAGDDDIYIAAFCVINGYTLITRNTKDFINIDGLNIEDWVEE